MATLAWRDLDLATSFEFSYEQLRSNSSRSFVVRFDTASAQCALDLTEKHVDTLLRNPVVSKQTQWFNFWAENADKDAITAIAKRYGVSPRLTGLLCSTRIEDEVAPAEGNKQTQSHQRACNCGSQSSDPDIESAPYGSPRYSSRSHEPVGFEDVVEKLWHFCCFPSGPRYLYVGFNALFSDISIDAAVNREPSKPVGLRIWTSILLCADGTVLSVFQRPPNGSALWLTGAIRRNVLNVLRQLSKLHSATPTNTLMKVSIRPDGDTNQVSIKDSDCASLLFYYLLDDWQATYAMITQRHNPYRDRLEFIRHEIFRKADMDLIRSLDFVGRQLTVLKLIYQSYELIICRLLSAGEMGRSSPQTKVSGADFDDLNGPWSGVGMCHDGINASIFPDDEGGDPDSSSSRISAPAMVRMQHLLDRIRLYALTEIDECLKQKDALVLMNFNLVALKDSQAVEKLTRTTILLAKVTILFLPVSLMTSYFSTQISGIEQQYDLKTYWLTLLVVVMVSIFGLFFFGTWTGKISGRMKYMSATRTLWNRVQRKNNRRI